MEEMFHFILPVFLFILSVVFFLRSYLGRGQTKKTKLTLSKLFDNKYDSKNDVWLAVHDGHNYECTYFVGSKKSPARLIFLTDCLSNARFELLTEIFIDRFSKHAGFSCEIETGDTSFDRAVLISSDMQTFVQRYFFSTSKRNAVLNLKKIGFDKITIESGLLCAEWNPFDLPTDEVATELTRSKIKEVLAAMNILKSNLPAMTEEEKLVAQQTRAAHLPFLYILPVLGFIAFLVCAVLSPTHLILDRLEMWLFSAKYSLPVALLNIVLGYFVLKKKSATSHRKWLGVVVASLVGLVLGGGMIFSFVNIKYDSSPQKTHEVSITKKKYKTKKGGKSYFLELTSWRPRSTHETLSVKEVLYNSVNPLKNKVVITSRAGKLGFEWVENIEVAGQDGPNVFW
ncbi:MAG: hypothetical protein HQM16_11370 [Deltaproteobacteria bacterium]|nr:hypothetical protein [Deltaproteobacteria bacterium]